MQAISAVTGRERWLAVHADVPQGEPGWHRTGALLSAPALLREVVDGAAGALAQTHPGATPAVRRAVGAALVLADWSWGLACVGAGSLAAASLVPDLGPDSVWLRWSGGRLAGVAVTGRRCAVPAGHPAAGRPGADAAADLDAALRERLAEALAPLHERLRSGPEPLLRFGPRSMWGAAGDGVATALRLLAGEGEDDLLAVADRLLQDAPVAWGARGFERLRDRAGREHVVRPRASCCLYYRLPDTGACTTCPRLTRAQLVDRLGEQP